MQKIEMPEKVPMLSTMVNHRDSEKVLYPHKAWIYCAIDAPEDGNGKLKEQRNMLYEYTRQMGMQVFGDSSDLGGKPLLDRVGFVYFLKNVVEEQVDTLVVSGRRCLWDSAMQQAQLQVIVKQHHLQIYSPLEGKWKM